jgi:small nuclear ribonucleoprotein (snRNP)-like protein
MANLGVPVKLLHESVGHVVTVELKTGQVSLEIWVSTGNSREDGE